MSTRREIVRWDEALTERVEVDDDELGASRLELGIELGGRDDFLHHRWIVDGGGVCSVELMDGWKGGVQDGASTTQMGKGKSEDAAARGFPMQCALRWALASVARSGQVRHRRPGRRSCARWRRGVTPGPSATFRVRAFACGPCGPKPGKRARGGWVQCTGATSVQHPTRA